MGFSFEKYIIAAGAALGFNMGTSKRRISLSLPPELDEVLARYSKLTGASQSSFVVDCLMQNVPTFNTLCDAIEAATLGNEQLYQDKIHQALGQTLMPFIDKDSGK